MKMTSSSSARSLAVVCALALTVPVVQSRDLGVLPCNRLDQVKTVVSMDRDITADGNGSLKVVAEQGASVTLVDQDGFHVGEGNTFWCVAKVKGAGIKQRAYLEMWCEFDKMGRAFSKGLGQILQGDTDWVEVRLPMMINQPALLKRALVNVVIEGPGTVWVDEVKFFSESGLSTVPQTK
ncbi:hypothetical protein [Verrucomicrobium sp. BvORR106]|uniref:hypothetical protein n=1 Tax=Verrucomicrobium sp. BvORR106 TaxID=1403819 RepID=UPI00056F2BC9|nr:hypothetical protein [Verrucomicrobium sp. BvORR106]